MFAHLKDKYDMKLIEINAPCGYEEVIKPTKNGISVEFIEIDKTKEIEKFLKPFFSDLTIISDEKYPESTFYKKNGSVLFELLCKFDDFMFFVDYDKIWLPVKEKFNLKEDEIKSFIATEVGNNLKINNVTPNYIKDFTVGGRRII